MNTIDFEGPPSVGVLKDVKKTKKTLLERAMELGTDHRQRIEQTEELVELTVAWFEGRVTNQQLSAVLWPDRQPREVTSLIYSATAICLKKAIASGRLKIDAGDVQK